MSRANTVEIDLATHRQEEGRLMSSSELTNLTAAVSEITIAWKATDEVGADLGTEVQNVGDRLCQLLNELAGRTVLPDETRATLRDASRGLQSTVDYYAELDEHDTDACLDIVARLPSALGLAQFAANQVTVAKTTAGHHWPTHLTHQGTP